MNLAYHYPTIFWNTANLIVDSGGVNYQKYEDDENDEEYEDDEIDEENEVENNDDDDNDDDDDDEEYEEWEEGTAVIDKGPSAQKKKKARKIDYGKIAAAIGRLNSEYGIKVYPPNINESSVTFTPKVKEDVILYGLRGITRLPFEKIQEIIDNRPYNSMQDCFDRIKLNITQKVELIKSGAFDRLEGKAREEIMADLLDGVADKKKKLNLQNMQMLINKQLIPDSMSFYAKLYLFNKFLKTNKSDIYYLLNEAAIKFIDRNFSLDYTEDGDKILQKTWDNLYKKAMDPMRAYLKEHQSEMLEKLNNSLYNEVKEKYAMGNISSWEMESLNFYYHDHELAKYQDQFDDFNNLPKEPEVEYEFVAKDGRLVQVYKIHTIIGTVIDKKKSKNLVTLLTPTGVVTVKIYKNQFALYDKQISQIGEDGKKHTLEKSWFRRGTLLRIQGIRRDHNFIPRKTKSSIYPVIMKIINTDNDTLEYQWERLEAD